MSTPLICIAGGGTGGHVMPALALADAARAAWDDVQVSFIGAERGLEAKLLPERGESVLLLTMHAIQGVSWLQKLRVLLWELPCSVLKILRHWRHEKPSILVGVGGYASVAGVLAALLVRMPVVLYEQNAIPGLVNRWLYRFCDVMMLGFPAAESHLAHHRKSVVTGNVIRLSIQAITYQAPDAPCLLVMGGSQGAMFLNETLPKACQILVKKHDFKVIHLVGAGQGRVQEVLGVYQQAGISAQVMAYCDDMPALLKQASLLVARSGAMTVCEAASVGLPAFFVPLPWAADQHQYFNALSLHDVGAAEIINQDACDANMLAEKLGNTLFNHEKLRKMAEKAKEQAIDDASIRQLLVLKPFLSGVKA